MELLIQSLVGLLKISEMLENTPKNLIIQVGGNDLTKEESNVESVSAEYAVLLAEVKAKRKNVQFKFVILNLRFK